MMPKLLFGAVALPVVLALSLPNNVGRLPALGWNSWNAYHCDVDANKIMAAANALVSKGLKAAGYQYVNIDDCWQNQTGRDPTTHQIVPDASKFPNGISGLANKIHGMGMKIGIYSSAGTLTCGGYPASLGYEQVDAATWAAWGIDYLKYDNCHVPKFWTDSCYSCIPDLTFGQNFVNGTCTSTSNEFRLCGNKWPVDGVNYTASYTALRYRIMGDALAQQNRTILYSLCEWGTNEPWTWANDTAQSWRTTDDVSPNWPRIAEILNMNSFLSSFAGFTGHNDPDMLEVGNGNLTYQETRSHFALWALMKSPLLIGTDLTNLSQANTDILLNKYLLAFNQDPVFGAPAQPYDWGLGRPKWSFNATNPAEYWAGASSKGIMVALMNTLTQTRSMTADFGAIPGLKAGGSFNVLDVWSGKSLGCKKGSVQVPVQGHDTAVFLVQGACQAPGGYDLM